MEFKDIVITILDSNIEDEKKAELIEEISKLKFNEKEVKIIHENNGFNGIRELPRPLRPHYDSKNSTPDSD